MRGDPSQVRRPRVAFAQPVAAVGFHTRQAIDATGGPPNLDLFDRITIETEMDAGVGGGLKLPPPDSPAPPALAASGDGDDRADRIAVAAGPPPAGASRSGRQGSGCGNTRADRFV